MALIFHTNQDNLRREMIDQDKAFEIMKQINDPSYVPERQDAQRLST